MSLGARFDLGQGSDNGTFVSLGVCRPAGNFQRRMVPADHAVCGLFGRFLGTLNGHFSTNPLIILPLSLTNHIFRKSRIITAF